MIEHIKGLIKSGHLSNILLAEQLCVGAKLDFDGLLEKVLDLQFWMDNLDDIPRTSRVEAACFLLSKTSINLSCKGLSELSESIGNLQNLQRLFLGNNNLNSLPESIGNLQNLKVLDLDNNNLSSLPKSIGNLQHLQRLDLEDNNLSRLPESIVNLQNLRFLDLSFNNLSNLLESIVNLQNLEALKLGRNPQLPKSEIDNIKKLLPNTTIT
jgi:Leucine-rich repeat (LRR) protein